MSLDVSYNVIVKLSFLIFCPKFRWDSDRVMYVCANYHGNMYTLAIYKQTETVFSLFQSVPVMFLILVLDMEHAL